MAVFKDAYHLDRAIDASISVRDKIEKLPIEVTEMNFKPHVSIGVNSGEMVSGNIGSASLRRLDYTVIGDAVNTAQRLQSAANQGQIIISEQSYEKIKESFHCERIGEAKLKNKGEMVVIYQVLE